jgi:alpha-maltose-1-phosphate synthase
MRVLMLYAYPPEPDGLSQQGHLLHRGLIDLGEEVEPVHMSSEFQKEWAYESFKPDVAIGVGFWGHAPDIISHPMRYGVPAVPWLVADGWVAGYHDELESVPLAFVTSTWVKSRYLRDGVDVSRFEVVPIGFDPKLFHPIPRSDVRVSAIRRKLGIRDDELMLLTAGGDVTSKGAQEVLKALKLIGKEYTNWKYVCKVWGGASADDHYDDEMALLEELGDAKDRVRYVEGSFSREFMPLMLNACDIYMAPSRLEGFGMIQMEAQACGVPVISIDAMGPQEVIAHGKTGFLAPVAETIELTEELMPSFLDFPEGHRVAFDEPKVFGYRADEQRIAEHLLCLMKDAHLRRRMGGDAVVHARANFHFRDVARRVATLVKERLELS